MHRVADLPAALAVRRILWRHLRRSLVGDNPHRGFGCLLISVGTYCVIRIVPSRPTPSCRLPGCLFDIGTGTGSVAEAVGALTALTTSKVAKEAVGLRRLSSKVSPARRYARITVPQDT